MRKELLSSISISVILLSGCASTSQPTSKVGIVNGKYAVTTTGPNNNKGKKVNITEGQSYLCSQASNGNLTTFKLIANKNSTLTVHDSTFNGKLVKGSFAGTNYFTYKPKYGFIKNGAKDIIRITNDDSGKVYLFQKKEDIAKNWASTFTCTQTTNNPYRTTRYMTDHEISAYQHNQNIAVQQESIDASNRSNRNLTNSVNSYNQYSAPSYNSQPTTYRIKEYHPMNSGMGF